MGVDVSWNYYRYAADYLHLGGMCFGLICVLLTRSVSGFSKKTQILYQLVYVTRYLDVFTESQFAYLLLFKATFNSITLLMLLLFTCLHDTYDHVSDSANLVAILLPVASLAFLTAKGSGFVDLCWTFSEFIEAMALVPQYIMCYKAKQLRPAVALYVLAVGGYRLLYVCNWIYKRYEWAQSYHDYPSWLGGGVECILFIDFFFRLLRHQTFWTTDAAQSFLGRFVLGCDDGAGKLSAKIELGTIGRRLPYGITGTTKQEEEDKRRQWNVSDQLASEEGSNLLSYTPDHEEGGC